MHAGNYHVLIFFSLSVHVLLIYAFLSSNSTWSLCFILPRLFV